MFCKNIILKINIKNEDSIKKTPIDPKNFIGENIKKILKIK